MKSIGIACFVLVIGISRAEAIDLTCSGVMHSYSPKNIEGAVASQGAVIDLEGRYITTPVGEFNITTISDDSISFGGSPNYKDLDTFGTLDRVTGIMRIYWRKPGDT